MGRPLSAERLERPELFGIPLGQDLYASIRQISNPAFQSQSTSFVPSVDTKEHALYPTGNPHTNHPFVAQTSPSRSLGHPIQSSGVWLVLGIELLSGAGAGAGAGAGSLLRANVDRITTKPLEMAIQRRL